MALVQQQRLRQVQSQRITPAMLMEFSLLQLPINELRESVTKEVESNPALEIEKDFVRAGVERFRSNSQQPSAENYLGNIRDERGETLDEHLLSNLRMSGVKGREYELAKEIVFNLDEDGRLNVSFADLIMSLEGRGIERVTKDELESARRLVMSTDPQGCGARDIAECYRAQLSHLPKSQRNSAEKAIDELAAALDENRQLKKDFRPSDLKAFMLLKNLERTPGRLYEHNETVFVTPDVFFDRHGNVRVDQGDIPELRVSQKYVEMAKDKELDKETRDYAADRVRRAREFVEAIARRKETIATVAELALNRQSDFITQGNAGIRKLTMSEIAKEAKCTIATVSRAAARKYVRTPRGTVPLRKFFSLVDQGPLEKLRELLEARPKDIHVPDLKISEEMAKAGFKFSRRTVTKYKLKWGL